MPNDDFRDKAVQFCLDFISTARRGALYSAQHPVVVESAKAAYAKLLAVLSQRDALHINTTADGKLMIEGEAVEGRDAIVSGIFPFLKKWQAEDITFSSGISEQEFLAFVAVLLWNDKQIAGAGSIANALASQKIEHIQLNLFSYLRVKKGEELVARETKDAADAAAVPPVAASAADAPAQAEPPAGAVEPHSAGAGGGEGPKTDEFVDIKQKIKELFRKKAPDPAGVEELAKQIFVVLIGEYKEDAKLSVSGRNVLTKFLVQSGDAAGFLVKLKASMLEAGIAGGEAEAIAKKLEETVARKQSSPGSAASGELELALKENERLRQEQAQLQQRLDEALQLLSRLQARAETIADEKLRLNSVMHNMSDGMIVVDPGGKILMVNASAQALLGVTTEALGRELKDVVKDEHLAAFIRGPGTGGEAGMHDVELISKNEETTRVVRASSAMVEDHTGKPVGMVAVLNDVTKQRELETLKQEFVAKVTHELRTPMIAAQKSVAILRSGGTGVFSQEQENFLDITERNLKRLSTLVNDLLDLSKLESGKLSIVQSPASVKEIVTDSLTGLSSWAQTKRLTLAAEIAADVPQVYADADRINQVLNNLIGNAIKFTPEGGVITVRARRHDAGLVELRVEDNGVGMRPEELDKVFDKFYQIRGTITSDVGGTGIGLTIAKEIVSLHGGTISVNSTLGKGTTFIFTVPVYAPESPGVKPA